MEDVCPIPEHVTNNRKTPGHHISATKKINKIKNKIKKNKNKTGMVPVFAITDTLFSNLAVSSMSITFVTDSLVN
jgi:hypothetical protein